MLIKRTSEYLGDYFYIRDIKKDNKSALDIITWINGFKILILNLLLIVVFISFGIWTGRWMDLAISLTVFIILRTLNKGHHFTMDQCLYITSSVILMPITISNWISQDLILPICYALMLIYLFQQYKKNKYILLTLILIIITSQFFQFVGIMCIILLIDFILLKE